VRAGLLIPAAVLVNAQYFDKNVVEKFVAEHVTSEEAAKLLGIGVLLCRGGCAKNACRQ